MLVLRATFLSRCLASCTKCRGNERQGSPHSSWCNADIKESAEVHISHPSEVSPLVFQLCQPLLLSNEIILKKIAVYCLKRSKAKEEHCVRHSEWCSSLFQQLAQFQLKKNNILFSVHESIGGRPNSKVLLCLSESQLQLSKWSSNKSVPRWYKCIQVGICKKWCKQIQLY